MVQRYHFSADPTNNFTKLCAITDVLLIQVNSHSLPAPTLTCLFCEALGLLANQFGIVEVVDLHGLAHLTHRLGTDLARLLRTFL